LSTNFCTVFLTDLRTSVTTSIGFSTILSITMDFLTRLISGMLTMRGVSTFTRFSTMMSLRTGLGTSTMISLLTWTS